MAIQTKKNSKESLAEYIDSLPRLRLSLLKKAQRGWDTGVTATMLNASDKYIASLKEILITLADYYSPTLFEKQSPQDFFSSIINFHGKWQCFIAEPEGVGTGGTLANVIASGGIISDIEKMVEDMAISLMDNMERDDMLTCENWRRRWRGKELSTFNHNGNGVSMDAHRVSAKVAADLKKMQKFFNEGVPDDWEIDTYQKEIAALLDKGFLDTIIYGFKQSGNWRIAMKYQAMEEQLNNKKNTWAGPSHANILGNVQFISLLSYSQSWEVLSAGEKREFERVLPFVRENKKATKYNGSWMEDKKYSSGSLGIKRYITMAARINE